MSVAKKVEVKFSHRIPIIFIRQNKSSNLSTVCEGRTRHGTSNLVLNMSEQMSSVDVTKNSPTPHSTSASISSSPHHPITAPPQTSGQNNPFSQNPAPTNTKKRKNVPKNTAQKERRQNAPAYPPNHDPTLDVRITRQLTGVGPHQTFELLLNIKGMVFPSIFELTSRFLHLPNGPKILTKILAVNHARQLVTVEQVVWSTTGQILTRGHELMSYEAVLRSFNFEGVDGIPKIFVQVCQDTSGPAQIGEMIYDAIAQRSRFAFDNRRHSPRLTSVVALFEELHKLNRFSGIEGQYQIQPSQTMHDYFLQHCTYAERTPKMDGTVREVATHLFNALHKNCNTSP